MTSDSKNLEAAETLVVEVGQWHVKVKLAGRKRFDFLTASGGTTHLVIHAPTWPEGIAALIAARILTDNPDAVSEAKAVPA